MSTAVFKPIQPHQPLRASFAEKRFRIDRVRRALFEPIDHAETQKFLERELAKHTINDCSKWEFDFRNEVPLSPKGTRGRFVWMAARQSDEHITYAPKRQRVLDDTDNSDLYPQHLEEAPIKHNVELRSDENKNAIITSVTTSQESAESVCKQAKQSKITDFMQARKRTAESAFAKKLSNSTTSGERPLKIPRECS